VIVCHREAVNDRTITTAVLSGAATIDEVGERCRAGTNCGGGHRMLERLLRDTGTEQPVTAAA